MEYLETRPQTLLRHGRLIAAGTVISMIVALVVSCLSPKVYRATTYLLISESKVNPDMSHREWDYSFLATYIQFVNNDALAAEAVKHFRLDASPYRLTPHRFLQSSVDAQVVKNTRLIQIDVDFRDARMAADLANYMAAGAVELNERINDVDTADTQKFLRARLDLASARLNDARQRSLSAEQRAHLEERERQLKILLDQKETVSHQAQDLRSALAQNKQRSESLSRSLVAEPRTLSLTKSIDSDRFLERATQALAPGAPAGLTATEEMVNPTRQELGRELADSNANAAADEAGAHLASSSLERIDSEATRLSAELAQLRGAISETSEKVKVAQEGYESAERDYRNASVTVTARSQDLKPVSPAIVPERPIRPRVLLNTMAAGILGLVVSSSIAFAIESARRGQPERLRVVEQEDAVGRYS